MPDPDEGMEYPKKRYQIFLKSTSGPVEVFLVSLHEKLDKQQQKAAEPSCVLPSSKVTSNLASKSNALGDDPADPSVDRKPAPTAANNGVNSSAAATRAIKLHPGATAPTPGDASGGAYPPRAAGETNVNGPTILRIMPPSCDPDYWFSDDVKEFGIGLNDIFAPGDGA